MKTTLLGLSLLVATTAHAQLGTPTNYEFMRVTEIEKAGEDCRILFAPAFQGKTEVPLERLPGIPYTEKYYVAYRHNSEIVTRQLERVNDLTG